MKTRKNESLNPGYQKEHFESQQAIMATLTTFQFFKVVIYLVFLLVVYTTAKRSAPSFTQNVNKTFQNFFFWPFEWLKKPCHYQKTVEFYWIMTSKQCHIGQSQFHSSMWYLWPSHSWRGKNNFKPKIGRKVSLVRNLHGLDNYFSQGLTGGPAW